MSTFRGSVPNKKEVHKKLLKTIAGIKRNGAEYLFSKEGSKKKFSEALAEAKKLVVEECVKKDIEIPSGFSDF